jgi:hypothetical protein
VEQRPDFRDNSYWQYYRKSVSWVLGNAFFGLLPLLFMMFIQAVSEKKVGSEEIQHLIQDGVVLFVCCAIIGAVLVEFILSGQRLKISTVYGWTAIPFSIFLIILTDYFLINLKAIDHSCFHLDSLTSKVVIGLTFVYCTFTKANLYLMEDTKHDYNI